MGVDEHENFDPGQQSCKIPSNYASARKRRSFEAVLENETSGESKRRRNEFTMAFSNWQATSKVHKERFEMLLDVFKARPEDIRNINDNLVCLEEAFLIGGSSYGTAIYICLGIDGLERAIKIFPKHLLQLLKNERRILDMYGPKQSPRIVRYVHSGIFGDICYLTFPLYEQSLEEYIKKYGNNITESRVRDMIRQVLQGLDAIHGNEPMILHTNLNPKNILVDVKGNLVISDFANGRIISEEGMLHTKGVHWIRLRRLNPTVYKTP